MQLEIQFFGHSANDILLARVQDYLEIVLDEYKDSIGRVSLTYGHAEGSTSERVIGSATIETRDGLRAIANDESGKLLELIQASRDELVRSLGARQAEGSTAGTWSESSVAAHSGSAMYSKRVHPSNLVSVG